jgi:hypothetical protein
LEKLVGSVYRIPENPSSTSPLESLKKDKKEATAAEKILDIQIKALKIVDNGQRISDNGQFETPHMLLM